MVKKVFKIGLHAGLSNYLRVKIILSNQIAALVLLIGLFYSLIAWSNFPSIFPLAFVYLLNSTLVFLLNYFHYFTASRFWLAISATLISSFNYLAISQGPLVPLMELFLVPFSSLLCSFILFDSRERLMRNVSFFVGAMLIFNNRLLNEWIDIPMDVSVLQTGIYPYINVAIALTMLFAFLAVLQSTNTKAERKNLELIKEMEARNREVTEKGEALEKVVREVDMARHEEQQRNWIIQGMARISATLQAGSHSEQLYDQLIGDIVKYVGANQGALYTVEEHEGKHLALVALYAYDRKKYVSKRIEPGQGLVGQCYLEKDLILMTQIPETYVHITSGLGQATPRFIAIVPMLLNGEVEGIIELASFQKIENYQLEFLRKIGESISSAFGNWRINQQTLRLLNETREQAEAMKTSEEEMRQHMEELHATQEEWQRREAELLKNKEVAEQSKGIIAQLLANEQQLKREIAVLTLKLSEVPDIKTSLP